MARDYTTTMQLARAVHVAVGDYMPEEQTLHLKSKRTAKKRKRKKY
jgi:hypothetical protein